ncbi:unnamed protein product [Rhizophagus irregularis]|uniref:chitinase n=2 Tax=Rhizophagus irregularis TaxID=588596 RepID=A0A916EEL8_9GLOM|nr:unnamed protein product [Rhizophagus irregularis]CAB5382084.1 unnamed protein product [Rhizophagus irregularis]
MAKYEPLSTSESSSEPQIKRGSQLKALIIILFFVVFISVWNIIPSYFYLEDTANNIDQTDQIPIEKTTLAIPTAVQTTSISSTLSPTSTPVTTPVKEPKPPMSESGKVIAAYFASWSIYARAYNVIDIDSDKVTHILYAFANIKPDGEVFLGDSWADTDKHFEGDSWNDEKKNLYGNFKQLGLLKMKKKHFKVSLSIGGWSWSTNFPSVASKSDSRKKFVTSSIELLKDLGLDGLDIDWEYPQNEGDAKNYVKLLKELREALDEYSESQNHSHKLLLTAALPCGEEQYKKMKLKDMNKYLDLFYLMAYDFSGSWSSKASHQSNLYGSDLSTHKAVDYYISKGVDEDKIVIGMPMYGRAFQNTNGFGSSYNGVGEGTWEQGVYDYKKLPRQNATEHFDEKAIASYSYSASDREFVTYDNPQVIIHKTDYVKHNNLRGVMFWELSGDFPTSHERSLLSAAYHGLGGKDAIDQTPNHRSFPDSIYENVRNGFE